MKILKVLAAAVIGVAVSYAGYIVFSFYERGNKSFDFAQSQAQTGRIYMDSMTQADYLEAATLARALMAEFAPECNWHTLSRFDQRDVPQEWKARGITFIRYKPGWVSFGWHGGPHAHTSLDLERKDDESIVFSAHYDDYNPPKQLKVLTKVEQGR